MALAGPLFQIYIRLMAAGDIHCFLSFTLMGVGRTAKLVKVGENSDKIFHE